MSTFRLSQDLNDTILNEIQNRGIISWFLKDVTSIKFLYFQTIHNIMQCIISNIFFLEVWNLLNALLNEQVHSIIVKINLLFELGSNVFEFKNNVLFVVFLGQYSKCRIFNSLDSSCSFTTIDKRNFSEEFTWCYFISFSYDLLFIFDVCLASSFCYKIKRIRIIKLLTNYIFWLNK